jgi:hypothetical protein
MSASSGPKTPLGDARRVLAILLGIGFVLGFLLTPLGVETRMKKLRSPAVAGFFIIVGLLMPLAGLVLLFRRPKLAAVLAVTDAALLFLAAPADQAKFFFTAEPPPAVTAGELVLTLLGIGYMLYGPRVYGENRVQGAPRLASKAANTTGFESMAS